MAFSDGDACLQDQKQEAAIYIFIFYVYLNSTRLIELSK